MHMHATWQNKLCIHSSAIKCSQQLLSALNPKGGSALKNNNCGFICDSLGKMKQYIFCR